MAMQPARQHMALEQYLLLVNNSDRLDLSAIWDRAKLFPGRSGH